MKIKLVLLAPNYQCPQACPASTSPNATGSMPTSVAIGGTAPTDRQIDSDDSNFESVLHEFDIATSPEEEDGVTSTANGNIYSSTVPVVVPARRLSIVQCMCLLLCSISMEYAPPMHNINFIYLCGDKVASNYYESTILISHMLEQYCMCPSG